MFEGRGDGKMENGLHEVSTHVLRRKGGRTFNIKTFLSASFPLRASKSSLGASSLASFATNTESSREMEGWIFRLHARPNRGWMCPVLCRPRQGAKWAEHFPLSVHPALPRTAVSYM